MDIRQADADPGRNDQRTEQDICATLRSLAGPLTVVAVTHQRALADAADQVLRLSDGKVRPVSLRLQARD